MNDRKTNHRSLAKLMELPAAGHTLLAATIALVRASLGNHIVTAQTASVLTDALIVLAHGDAAACQKQIQVVRNEKNILAPDCATCANPCVRTAEYPIEEFLSEETALQEMKADMLWNLVEHDDPIKNYDDVCRKLFMFGYAKDVEKFAAFWQEIKHAESC